MNLKKVIVGGVGIIAAIYLLNPGFGIFELIPDNIPLIGNMDEASATFLVIYSLSFFGIDLSEIFGGWSKKK